MTREFTTFSNKMFVSQVDLEVGKIYRVPFAGKKVRARFLGAANRDLLLPKRGGGHTRIGKVVLDWERVEG